MKHTRGHWHLLLLPPLLLTLPVDVLNGPNIKITIVKKKEKKKQYPRGSRRVVSRALAVLLLLLLLPLLPSPFRRAECT
jgi:hypothetical protein